MIRRLPFLCSVLVKCAPAAIVLLAAGCTAAPKPDYDAQVARATGIGEPIRFEMRGGPADVRDSLSPTLTLPEAVRQALAHDPSVQAAIARVRAATADAQQARLLPNPVLNVAFRFPEDSGKPIIDAGLTADLLSVLQQPRRASAADARLRAASSEVLTAVLDLLSNVQEHYAAIQSLDAQMGVLDERGKLIGRLLDLARARLDKGEGTQFDVTSLQAQQVELETEVAERQLEQRDERLQLARLIGRPSGDARWQVSKWQMPGRVAAARETEWIAAAVRHRPEAQARRWELAALGDELALARLAPFEGTEVGVDSERDANWTVGPAASVPLPLFDWGQARRAKATAQVIEARHNLTQTLRQVVEDVRRAYASFASTDATLAKVQSQLIPLQERRRQQAEAAYLAGQTDITGLLVAEQDLQATRTKLVELQRKTSEASIRLERAVGGAGVVERTPPSGAPATRPAPPATTPTTPAAP